MRGDANLKVSLMLCSTHSDRFSYANKQIRKTTADPQIIFHCNWSTKVSVAKSKV